MTHGFGTEADWRGACLGVFVGIAVVDGPRVESCSLCGQRSAQVYEIFATTTLPTGGG